MAAPGSIEFPLPARWHPVSPGELNLDVAFLAIRLDTHGSGFTATVVIEGMTLEPGSSLTDLADHAAAAQPTGIVISRSAWEGPRGPRLRQVLRLTDGAGPRLRWLVRVEEYAVLQEGGLPTGLPVLRATSTATLEQAEAIATDFELMVSGLDSDSPTADRTAVQRHHHPAHGT
ncbi:hypothetical protein GCM10011581_33810 [Saccharopolyspora subtropica]|uniref:Uncharacterized protein n=1 Tax=Saccharopolyspora thermophila TaxID=89367 RepID=A0A917K1S9_9PSEU|nr:hypothetical protein [Saccharopolyspora subtropica]GGI93920.1 hypothetical protein GCM10011581_33810 [Saccharopolyspora subtropica]